MAMTTMTALGLPVPIDVIAGPGQKPAKPQPAPNKRLPITRRLSIMSDVGKRIAPPKKLVVRFFAKRNATMATKIAPPITKARDGSHVPVMSRKPITFAGLVIPAKMSPMPKIKPTKKEDKVSICFFI